MLRRIIITVLLTMSLAVMAQSPKKQSKQDRAEWFKEMRQQKHDFIEKEIDLTKEQRDRFFALYDQMSERTMKMFDDVRAREIALQQKGDAATDDEYLAMARTMAEVKSREGAIETAYFEKFSQILSARQLLKLKKAERKFNQYMMKQHARSKKNNKTPDARGATK